MTLFLVVDIFLKDDMGNSDNEDIKLFEKFKFIFWLDKFCLSLSDYWIAATYLKAVY